MQDAEEDESLGNENIRREADGCRRGDDDRQVTQISAGTKPRRMRKNEAYARNRQKSRADRLGKNLEGRPKDDARIDVAEIGEIPRQVKGKHRDDRDAAHRIDQRDAAGAPPPQDVCERHALGGRGRHRSKVAENHVRCAEIMPRLLAAAGPELSDGGRAGKGQHGQFVQPDAPGARHATRETSAT